MAGSSSSNQPLNAGNLVSAAVKIYRSRLNQFLGVAFTATLWSVPPLLAAIIPIGGTVFATAAASDSGGLIGLPNVSAVLLGLLSVVLWLGWIGLFCFCLAKNLMNTALISRLAYGELISQPETIQEARGQLNRKIWKFLRVWIFAGLFLFVASFSINIAAAIVIAIVQKIFGEASPLTGLVSLVLNLAVLVAAYWVQARVFISEVPLAIEDNINSMDSIRRSWELSKGSAGQIITAIVIATLITLPLSILAFIPFILTLIANLAQFAAVAQGEIPSSAAGIALFVSLAISILLVLFLGIFIIPFWQSLKALIYFNLRGWREGSDLQLRGNTPG